MGRRFVIVICCAVIAVLGVLVYQLKYAGSSPSVRDGEAGEKARPAVPVVTEQVRTETFHVKRRTIGTLESPAVVLIRSRIDSQILQQHVTDGQIVKKGQLLFTLDDRELKAQVARDQATLAKDLAAQVQTRAQLVRTQQLTPKGISTPQQLEQAQAAFSAAEQTVEADRAVLEADRLKLGYATIEAPMGGRLGAIRTTPGNLVSANDASGIVTITRIRELRVNFTLPESDLKPLRAAYVRTPPATVSIFSAANGDAPAAAGRLDFVDSAVDQSSGTIAARASIPNDNFALWPGQFVEVEVELSARPDTAMLPTPAIVMGQRGPYVFIAGSDGKVEIRFVKVGGTEATRTAILEGLAAGERVVVDGQSRLSPGSRWLEAAPGAGTPSGEASATPQPLSR